MRTQSSHQPVSNKTKHVLTSLLRMTKKTMIATLTPRAKTVAIIARDPKQLRLPGVLMVNSRRRRRMMNLMIFTLIM